MNQQQLIKVIPPTAREQTGAVLRQVSSTSSAGLEFSRDEMNLAEFPLAVLSTRVNPKVKTLEFKDTQRLKSGETIDRNWIITGADKFGLPTSTDDDVMLGLVRLSMNHGFREQKVYFTRYELLKILQWTTEGRSYSRLTKSLDRLSGVRIKAANAFYDNNTKSYQTCNFGIIDAYEINDERGGRHFSNGENPKSFFIWSEVLFDSFKAGYIKKLDLKRYFALKSAVSRRLYRYLDKHFYYRSTHEKPLTVLAFEKLGLSRNYKYASSIKQQLEPAFEELIENHFLSHVEYKGRGLNTSVKFYANRCEEESLPVYAANSSQTEENLAPKSSPIKDTQLEAALIARGISPQQVGRLLGGKTRAELVQIASIIRYYDHLVAGKDNKVSRNKVGFLYRAVEKPLQFTLPKSFSTAAPKIASVQELGVEERKKENLLEQYRRYVDAEAERCQKGMSKDELMRMYAQIERKMGPLKTVLARPRFEEAVAGCLKDEIAKISGVVDFQTWQKRNSS